MAIGFQGVKEFFKELRSFKEFFPINWGKKYNNYMITLKVNIRHRVIIYNWVNGAVQNPHKVQTVIYYKVLPFINF